MIKILRSRLKDQLVKLVVGLRTVACAHRYVVNLVNPDGAEFKLI